MLLLAILLLGATPVSALPEVHEPEHLNFPSNHSVIINASGGLVKININGTNVTFINSLPVIINESGYYILNLSANVSGTAIEIDTDNVVLDGNGNVIRGNGWSRGLYIWKHKNITIKNLRIENFGNGIEILHSEKMTITDNTVTNNKHWGIVIVHSSNVLITGNIINSNERGISLGSSNNVHLVNNVFLDNGLFVWGSYNNTVVNNTVNERPLVYIEDADEFNLTTPSYAGQVVIVNSKNVLISNQNLSNAGFGMELWNVTDSYLINNTIKNNAISGVYLIGSSNVHLVNNVFLNDGLFVLSSYNNTVVNNTVNGKPLIYIENSEGFNLTIPNYAGQVIMINSKNVLIANQDLINASVGIEFWGVQNARAENNTVTNNSDGIHLWYLSNITVANNNITNNKGAGIYLVSSSNVMLTNNTITNNCYGVHLWYSSNVMAQHNTIMDNDIGFSSTNLDSVMLTGNTIANNKPYGVILDDSSNVTIFLNEFMDNSEQVEIYDSENVSLRSPKPLKYIYDNKTFTNYLGNYWSDYTGLDANGDGIGDSPYVIRDDFRDEYPLIAPPSKYIGHKLKGDVNEDGRITATDALLYLRFAIGLDISPYQLDPVADDMTGDGRITATDALKVLRIAVGLDKL